MKLTTLVEAIGIGAAAMYFFDPKRGAQRRTMLKDQAQAQMSKKIESVDVMVRDFTNRSKGWRHKAEHMLDGKVRQEQPDRDRDGTGRWTPATSLIAGGAGILIGLSGTRRGGLMGTAMQLIGTGMVAKAFHDTEHRFDPSNSQPERMEEAVSMK